MPSPPTTSRYAAVAAVLGRVLALNLAVALAKLAFGYTSGSVSIVSDGFHSLTDSASNVIGLFGVRAAEKPPDADHPYGHRKYETLSAGVILIFLVLVLVEILRTALTHLGGGAPATITVMSFAVMAGTIGVNAFVIWYEGRAAVRLGSELLLADARHTRSDLMTSTAVIAALVGVRLGYPVLDPLAALLVAGFIAHAGYEIARQMSEILADRIVIAADDLREVVMSVPGILGCHQIRTRGSADHVFLDLHVWLAPETRLDAAHGTSHVVKDRLMSQYPQLADVIIHIEPPPAGWTEAVRLTRDRLSD